MVTAGAIAQLVRSGERRAVDIVADALDRSEASPHNAYTLLDRDGALERAEALDAMVARGVDPGPLAGVPIALKDLIDQAGLPTTCGSGFYREIPARSATVVDRLEAAGAVIVGRTGLHEFAYGFSSENHWFGPVRNPWDLDTSPGGSSGGSAVAVAAGLTPIAIGTDTGGSVRVPAAMCAVVGLKVTHGRVPLTGVFPLAEAHDTVGPLARSVGDAALVYGQIAGYDPADPWSASRDVEDQADGSLAGLRVGVPHPWLDDAPIESQVVAAFDGALTTLSEAGAQVTDLDVPWLAPAPHISDAISAQAAQVHRPWFGRERYGPEVQERLVAAFGVTLDDYLDARRRIAHLRNRAAALFRDIDVIVTPTVPATRKQIGESTIDGVHYITVLSWFSSLVNHLGAPALTAPLRAPGTPPPSLQLIGPWWSERRLLALGETLEGIELFETPSPPEG
jgi:Asp-tRNA(Asn)/Glu-tRNA(Gln) amidotransferase A subunit family amidase